MTTVKLPRIAAFWSLAALFAAVMGASAVVTPLYGIYQEHWGFSAVTLTSVFAVYALTLLATLLVIGSVSDRVGRRPIIALGVALDILAMLFFIYADGVGWLFAARGLQGVATALVMGTTTAALIDLDSKEHPIAPVVNSSSPMAGLAVGAAAAGALVQWAPSPTHLVFWIVIGIFVAGLGLVAASPETVARNGSWREAVGFHVGLPDGTREAFAAALPGIAATWSLGGLYFSLGPALAHGVLGNGGHIAGGLVITALTGTGALAAYLVRNWEPERMLLAGMQAFAVGVALTVVSLVTTSTPLFFAATVIAGFGFGPGFLGALRSLTALAPPDARAEMVSSIYIVSYLSFSIPAVAAGAAVTQFGLRPTADVYGIAAVVLALAAAFLTAARKRTLNATTAT